MKKRMAAALLGAALACGAAGAQALTLTGLETETVARSWEDNLFFARMEALTGVEITAHGVTDAAAYADLLASMTADSAPADALFKANLTRAQEIELLDRGAIIDLAPLMEANMPNLSALLASHPEWREVLTLDDGRIASLPLLNPAERQVCVWINEAWLRKLNLSMPQSLSELTQALLAMQSGDPNGNYKPDEIPADLLGVFEMRWLLPYFGIVADDYHIARDADGQAVFAPELPAYRDFVALLRDWTAQGILPPSAFREMHSTAALMNDDKDKAVTSGMLVSLTPYTHVPADAVDDYQALLMPGPDGTIRWRDMLGDVWTGCFAVSAACEDPAQALRWADALYGEAGALLAYAGAEGEDYELNPDGRWSFLTSPARPVSDIRSTSLIYTGAATPGLYPAAFIMNVDSAVDRHVFAQSERVRAVSETVTPAYALCEAAQARADELALTLGGMVERGIARFATGEVPLESYDAWLEELRAAGSGELAALFNP